MFDVIDPSEFADTLPVSGASPAQCTYFHAVVERLSKRDRDEVARDILTYCLTRQTSVLMEDVMRRAAVLRDADRILESLPAEEGAQTLVAYSARPQRVLLRDLKVAAGA